MKRPLVLSFCSASLPILAFAMLVSGQASKSVRTPTPAVKPAPVHLEDIASQSGLTALNVYGGDTHKEYIIETTGNGAVIFDYDNDGWPDVFLPTGSTVEGFANGNAPTGHVYNNNDDGTFTDVTEKAGLKTERAEWSTGCSFIDYDRDGKADLFIARYVDFSYDSVPRPGQGPWCQWKGLSVMCGPRGLKSGINALYHNEGNGTFSDVSKKSGITKYPMCYGLTALSGDYDNDGWTDIYVACDSTPNILYHNNHDGTFSNLAADAGVAYNQDGTEQAGMGLSADDYTHSGEQGIVKTNFSDDTTTLYLNRGNNDFDDVTFRAGLGKIRNWLGWGVQFYDYDNSGWPGILIDNGHVYPEVDGKGLNTSYREPKVAYYNLHNGEFANITGQAGDGPSESHSGRGMALGDLFNDGHLEALVNNMNETPSLYYNTAPVGNFIKIGEH